MMRMHVTIQSDTPIPPQQARRLNEFLTAVAEELNRAQTKFPDSGGSMCALTEEVGELAKAMLDEPSSAVYKEAVQVATMAARVAMEGDHTLDFYRNKRGADTHPPLHTQSYKKA